MRQVVTGCAAQDRDSIFSHEPLAGLCYSRHIVMSKSAPGLCSQQNVRFPSIENEYVPEGTNINKGFEPASLDRIESRVPMLNDLGRTVFSDCAKGYITPVLLRASEHVVSLAGSRGWVSRVAQVWATTRGGATCAFRPSAMGHRVALRTPSARVLHTAFATSAAAASTLA
ncbi:Protein of unknown function [Gryllus bimaculatus]|nr:Protein of unknown function [Gryllus bimaculatus]